MGIVYHGGVPAYRRDRYGRPGYFYNCGDRTCGAPDCGSCRNGRAPWDEECAGPEDQCDGCEFCSETVQTTKRVIARAPRTEKGRKRRERNGIKPGDTITVESGFHYQKNGPRLGYFRRERLVRRGQG